jgi:hypothetical protein
MAMEGCKKFKFGLDQPFFRFQIHVKKNLLKMYFY